MANELSVDLVFKAKNAQQAARQGANEVNATLASQVKGLRPTSIEKEDAGGLIRSRKAAAAKRAENNRIEIAYEVEAASRRNRAAALLRQRQQKITENQIEEASRRNQARALLRQRKQARDDESSAKASEAMKMSLKGIAIATAIAGAGILTLKKIISEVGEAANKAAATYAKILQSGGMASGFVVKREQLAKIIGVSEDQVMQYGAAINYLNSKLEWSTKIFTETNPTLTALAWNFRILENDFSAMIAKLSTDGAPAFNAFLDFLDEVIKKGTNILTKGEPYLPAIGHGMANTFPGGQILEGIWKWMEGDAAKNPIKPVPQAPISLNRFPASSWQKMGLVIGGGGRSPQEKIAQNTSKTVTHLQQIVNLLQPRTGNARNPANILANPMYPQP